MNLSFLQDFSTLGVLLLGAVVCAALEGLQDAGGARERHLSRWAALAFLLLAFLVSIGFWRSSLGPAPPDVEHGSFLIDRFALFFYAAGPAAAAAIVLCGADLEAELELHQPMYHALLLVATAGVVLTASAADLGSLLVGLALVALPMAMAQGLRKIDAAGLRRTARSVTVTGSLLAAFAAGEAILAGLGHATQLTRLQALPPSALLAVAALLLVVGSAGQLGVFPLMRWRAGQGEATPLAPALAGLALLSLAVAAALLRLLPGALGSQPGGWTLTVSAIAGATLLIAPVLAWRQRRLLPAVAYLLVAQSALVLVGLVGPGRPGTAAVLYLTLGLVPMVTAALAILGAMRLAGSGDGLSAIRGLAARSPLQGGLLALLLAALGGLPPLASFFARLLVVETSLQAGLGWLAAVAVLAAIVSAAVALRWLLAILDLHAEGPQLDPPGRATLLGLALSVAALAGFTVALGPLMGIAARAALAPLAGP